MGVQGSQGNLILSTDTETTTGNAYSYSVSSVLIPFDSESMQARQIFVTADGTRGTRAHNYQRYTEARTEVSGAITFRPGYVNMGTIMERVLGGTIAAGVVSPAETLPYFGVLIDRVATVSSAAWEYLDCKVARCIIRGSAGEPIEMTLELIGRTEGTSTAFPGSPPTITDSEEEWRPIVFSNGTLTAEGATPKFENFELTIDNVVEPIFRNQNTAHEIRAQDRVVTLSTDIELTTANVTAHYHINPGTEAAGILAFSNDLMNLQFDFAKLVAPQESPVVTGKNNIPLPLSFTAFEDASNPDIKCTIDENPDV